MTCEGGAGTVDLDGNDNNLLFTVRSTADSTARIANVNGWTLSGKAVVERYVPAQRKWRLISVPTVPGETLRQALTRQIDGSYPNPVCFTSDTQAGSGTLITGHSMSSCTNATSVGFDHLVSGGSSSIRYYNSAASNPWASATSTPNVLTAPTQSGYLAFIRGDRQTLNTGSSVTTLRPKGDLIQGNHTIPFSSRFFVLGNPYASPISFESLYEFGVEGGNASKIKRTFWIWDANLTTSFGGVGGYRTFSPNNENAESPSYTVTPALPSGTSINDFLMINSGQAILVERRPESLSGNIIVKESHKMSDKGNMLNLRVTNTDVAKIKVDMYRASGSTLEIPMDGVVARFADWYNSEPTDLYDVYKNNQFEENLSLVRKDISNVSRYLSIESRPLPKVNDTIYLPMYYMTSRGYAFKLSAENMAASNLTALLQDRVTGSETEIPLNGTETIYPFSMTSTQDLTRFRIVFIPGATLPVTFLNIKAKVSGASNIVEWSTAYESAIKTYEVERSSDGNTFQKLGEQQPQNNQNGAAYQWVDPTPVNGSNYYRIRSVDEDGSARYSMVVKVNRGIDVKEVFVNSNISAGGSITLQLNGQPAGMLSLSLASVSGQILGTKRFAHTGGSSTQVLQITDQPMTDGVYFLTVQTAEGMTETFKLVK
jgi:hypothetical protein